MSKRLIGIEIGNHKLRVAILTRDKGQLSISSLQSRDYAGPDELTTQLEEVLSGEFRIGDFLVASLPSRSAYVRRLEFPFRDEKKIAAAIPFELSSQLPIAVDNCATSIQKSQQTETGASVATATVTADTLQSMLAPFEEAALPLHLIDLAPFCYVAGLGEQIGDGILFCATDQEATVSLVQNGRLEDYRILPAGAGQASAAQLQQLRREIRVLKHIAGAEDLPISLMGAGVTQELAEALKAFEQRVTMLSLELGGQLIDGEFMPAVALALRAGVTKQDRSFNFRQGNYALKGEWANLKRKLVLLAALLGMVMLIMLGSMTFKYADKVGRDEQLQAEIVNVYRTLFPQATTIVDVPMQLKSAIRDLQAKGSLVAGDQTTTLAILKEISSLAGQATVEFQEFALSPEELKLAGRAASFEMVNQMARTLGESSLFAKVQVSDAKMSLDGSRIDFRLLLSLANQGTGQ